MFDTHAVARALTAAAFPSAPADALTDAVRQTAEHDAAGVDVGTLATKDAEFERSRERSDTWIAASRF